MLLALTTFYYFSNSDSGLIKDILNTSPSVLFYIVGLILIVIALVRKIGVWVSVETLTSRFLCGFVGVTLIIGGHFIFNPTPPSQPPPLSPSPSPSLTAKPTTPNPTVSPTKTIPPDKVIDPTTDCPTVISKFMDATFKKDGFRGVVSSSSLWGNGNYYNRAGEYSSEKYDRISNNIRYISSKKFPVSYSDRNNFQGEKGIFRITLDENSNFTITTYSSRGSTDDELKITFCKALTADKPDKNYKTDKIIIQTLWTDNISMAGHTFVFKAGK